MKFNLTFQEAMTHVLDGGEVAMKYFPGVSPYYKVIKYKESDGIIIGSSMYGVWDTLVLSNRILKGEYRKVERVKQPIMTTLEKDKR